MSFNKFPVPTYQYKGYTYDPYEDVEYGDEGPENVKIFHYVKKEGQKDKHMDWSPYSVPTFDQFKLWIDLEFPERITGGPLDAEDLQKILEASE